jgi:SAM-dependent methyltransferase
MSGETTPDFDRLASVYRWMEWLSFGPFLHRCRRAFLAELGTARRALILGDGDGRFTADLLRTNPEICVDAVDASPAMLAALLCGAVPNAARVTTHAADVREWVRNWVGAGLSVSRPNARHDVASGSEMKAAEPCDLVVTHFFLDCLTTDEVRDLAAGLRPHLEPGALWILSDFAQPPGLYGRLIALPLIGFLYHAFGLLTGLRIRRLPDHRAALAEAGFTLIGRRALLGGLLVAEMWHR